MVWIGGLGIAPPKPPNHQSRPLQGSRKKSSRKSSAPWPRVGSRRQKCFSIARSFARGGHKLEPAFDPEVQRGCPGRPPFDWFLRVFSGCDSCSCRTSKMASVFFPCGFPTQQESGTLKKHTDLAFWDCVFLGSQGSPTLTHTHMQTNRVPSLAQANFSNPG